MVWIWFQLRLQIIYNHDIVQRAAECHGNLKEMTGNVHSRTGELEKGKSIVFHVLFVFYRNLHRPGWVYIWDFGSVNCLFHGIGIWDSYYQRWFYNVVESDLENARFSRTGVSTNLNLTYKIAKIDCFEGHVWPDCENMSYATTLRIKSLTKDNLRQLRFWREDISVTGDFGRRPKRPKCPTLFALHRKSTNPPILLYILYVQSLLPWIWVWKLKKPTGEHRFCVFLAYFDIGSRSNLKFEQG